MWPGGGGVNILSNFMTLTLTVWEWSCFVSQSVNYKAVCRTAPATLGLSNTLDWDLTWQKKGVLSIGLPHLALHQNLSPLVWPHIPLQVLLPASPGVLPPPVHPGAMCTFWKYYSGRGMGLGGVLWNNIDQQNKTKLGESAFICVWPEARARPVDSPSVLWYSADKSRLQVRLREENRTLKKLCEM